MTALRQIDPTHARRLIISKQHLDGASRPPMFDVIRDLGCLQLDPIRKVERPHWLILWSRLGVYDRAELETLRWEDRSLFEYWAHAASIVLTEDYAIHATNMRYEQQKEKSQQWFDEHNMHDLRQQVLERIRSEGALKPSDFEYDGRTAEHFSGWTSNKSINRLMQYLWTMGEIVVAKRQGNARYWDVPENFFPDWTPMDEISPLEANIQALQKAVKGLGLAGSKAHINYHYTRGRYWHYQDALEHLLATKKLERVQINGWEGDWLLHTDDVPLLEKIQAGEWAPKTTLLSPFDNLICDRDRTEQIWDFRYRIEIYVPKAKREFGYYVLPILNGDQLIGRMDIACDRKTKQLEVIATYAQGNASAEAVADIRAALHSLAQFLECDDIIFGETMPQIWSSLKD